MTVHRLGSLAYLNTTAREGRARVRGGTTLQVWSRKESSRVVPHLRVAQLPTISATDTVEETFTANSQNHDDPLGHSMPRMQQEVGVLWKDIKVHSRPDPGKLTKVFWGKSDMLISSKCR